ncbi:sugar transferase [Novosphingobium sp. AAP83]|uniref:sugar transferase n=1 Tax=Novosphingobium sp. AAP83 TaxID=1523425 RepID=UPI000AE48829|nr:sugar transferase [Novosphingobium sp. AAP83]
MNMYTPFAQMKLHSKVRFGDRWGRILRTNRFTLGGLLIVGVGVPLLVLAATDIENIFAEDHDRELLPTIIVVFVAAIFAHIMLRNVGALALTTDRALIFPSFFSAYAAAIAGATILGVKVGISTVALSFLGGMGWYLIVASARRRAGRPRVGYIGYLPEKSALRRVRINWVSAIVERAELIDVVAVVFDKHRPEDHITEQVLQKAVLQGIPVYRQDYFREMVTGTVSLDNHPVENFGYMLPSRPLVRGKRLADLVVVVPALLMALPVLIIVGLAIKIESPGGALYRQQRVGYRGRRFVCYKLRSMRCDVDGPAFTTENDHRVTRVGKLIRKLRIDELPQLYNVLRGDMSLIGPRPESVILADQYAREIPFYVYRHSVRPGITGWAAVHQGNVAHGDAARQKLEYDFYYIKHCSVWLDFLIVLLTIRTIVTGFGSR